ncbi:DUF3098 domain-containing protein [Faecalibacter rhinopitheci]|uniref:DUF3098 domain-containing protein n=1 Tax=Faecalibacter rhinopitheci TaxID=2779678 RepID=A0A8J7FQL4_9FLAO|nr:DUF3098 domain-containing protein [Faecalibacter rhinopitheci]MBF0597914.1 DUF3098 domain-containing protein [Faecalibacter rhinopitheci]MBQ0148683.1 DUF3098 domain-containing protein [Candidatus Onthonaster equi]
MSIINKQNTIKSESSKGSDFTFLFGKRNYIWMGIGLALIALGFILMTGHDANTRPDGTYDVNYWNEDIYSWTRIRLAPFLILTGFAVEIYAILINPNKDK